MVSPSSIITTEYRKVWSTFTQAAETQRLNAVAENVTGVTVTRAGSQISAQSLMLLRGWPYKRVSSHRKVDILVDVAEYLVPDDLCIVRASTAVAYFIHESDGVVPRLELHFDYDANVQEAHPLFHAQLGGRTWDANRLRNLSYKLPTPPRQTDEYASARLPTPFMGYIPIIVMLAADYLSPENYRIVINAVRKISRIPLPVCSLDGITSRKTSEVPQSHTWYDSRYVVKTWVTGPPKNQKYHARVDACDLELTSNESKEHVVSDVVARLRVSRSSLYVVDVAPPVRK